MESPRKNSFQQKINSFHTAELPPHASLTARCQPKNSQWWDWKSEKLLIWKHPLLPYFIIQKLKKVLRLINGVQTIIKASAFILSNFSEYKLIDRASEIISKALKPASGFFCSRSLVDWSMQPATFCKKETM